MVAYKLKRDCPFCGQDKNSYIGIYCMMADVEKPWYVQCNSCGGKTGNYYEEESAVKAWNGEWRDEDAELDTQ